MKTFCQRLLFFWCMIALIVSLSACEKKKDGKLEITEKKYHLSQFSENGWAIDASGKIRNIGEVDVKRVVVTGVCKSCIEVWTPQKWFSYSQEDDIVRSEQKDVEKVIGTAKIDPSSFDQKDVISYIPAGEEASFAFKEFAYFYTQSPDQKPEMPPAEELDVIIESFLTADD